MALRLFRGIMSTTSVGGAAITPKERGQRLADLTRSVIAARVDSSVLKKQWENTYPGEVRDALTIILGSAGDPSMRIPLGELIVDRRRSTALRELAVPPLVDLAVKQREPSVGKLLAQAAREDSLGIVKLSPPSAESPTGGRVFVLPFRRAAIEGIKRLQEGGLMIESFVIRSTKLPVEMPLPSGVAASPP